MKLSNECILVLSLYSYAFAIGVAVAYFADALIINNYLGIGMILLAVAQVGIAIIAVVTGRNKNGKK